MRQVKEKIKALVEKIKLYLVKIKWIKSVPASKAKWKNNSGLFTTQLIKASLENQTKTIKFLEKEFEVNFQNIMN